MIYVCILAFLKGEDDEEKDPKNPALVPRRTGFWNHDDRYDEIPVEESRLVSLCLFPCKYQKHVLVYWLVY